MEKYIVTESIKWDAYVYYKVALMIQICPLNNLIIYLAVQIDNRDHRKENKEILRCSCTSQRFWPQEPEMVRLQLLLERWKNSSDSRLADVDHTPPPWAWFISQPIQMSLLAVHHRTVLGWAVSLGSSCTYVVQDSSLPEASAGDTCRLLTGNINSFSFIPSQRGSF